MKKWTLIICSVALFYALDACRPSKDVTPAAPDPITRQRLWSGYYLDSIYYNLGPSIHHQMVDTSLTILKVSDSVINMPYFNVDPRLTTSINLKYRSTDSIAGIIRYDTSGRFGGPEKASLLYYYLADSLVFDYEQYYPIENPHKVTMHLYSYH